jgi:hypothetical protein
MKKIYLIAFRGTGFRDEKFVHENTLIRAGHVGFSFEGDETSIFGFHPTPEAVKAVGGDESAIAWLREKNTLEGTVQQDYSVFARAAELVTQGARTRVWQFVVEMDDETFEHVRQQALQWYNEKRVFPYAFPPDEPKADRDNCATFPRRLGLPVFNPVGQIKDYVRVLEARGQAWSPKGT